MVNISALSDKANVMISPRVPGTFDATCQGRGPVTLCTSKVNNRHISCLRKKENLQIPQKHKHTVMTACNHVPNSSLTCRKVLSGDFICDKFVLDVKERAWGTGYLGKDGQNQIPKSKAVSMSFPAALCLGRLSLSFSFSGAIIQLKTQLRNISVGEWWENHQSKIRSRNVACEAVNIRSPHSTWRLVMLAQVSCGLVSTLRPALVLQPTPTPSSPPSPCSQPWSSSPP